jgi:hypothetical protein
MGSLTSLLRVSAIPLFCACSTTLPAIDTASRVEEVQCGSGSAEAADIRLVQQAVVLKAEPLYSHVMTGGNGAEERVDGAKLVIRPPEGVSAERMTRIIQCHSAQALLGKIDRSAFPDDPFWLPNTWVSVEVRPEAGHYAVVLEANDLPTNIELAHRVIAYAESHTSPGAAAPSSY